MEAGGLRRARCKGAYGILRTGNLLIERLGQLINLFGSSLTQ